MTSNSLDPHESDWHSPFDSVPEFYLDDNRQYRYFNPITKAVLEAKMRVLIPEWLVRDKSVLDLGSCLGAAGHWALSYGAKKYVGVEVQPEYAKRSSALLKPWGCRATIVESGIRPYLLATETESFDIVIAMGVMYLFLDPDVIVSEMCRVAVETVAVESTFPRIGNKYSVTDPTTAVLSYGFSQDVNMSDGRYSLRGLAATPSPGALDIYFRRGSFVNREGLLEYPVLADTAVYSPEPNTIGQTTTRFGARYHRVLHQRTLRTLEESIPAREGTKREWVTDLALDQVGNSADRANADSSIDAIESPWIFDDKVALDFDRIAKTSIPHYDEVIEKSISIIQKSEFTNPKIIDVGSAIGTTLKRLFDAGFHNLYGVDSSPAMIARSFEKANLICSDSFPVSLGPFDVVVANWVLHFIPERKRYLASISSSLAAGGLLILSEKVISTPLCHDLYHDFKRANGLSELEIETKQRQLRGVLVQYPLNWYLSTLLELGFESVDVIDAHFSFVTLLARKAALQ